MITEDINNSHEEINTENEPVLNIKTNLLKLEGRIRLDNPINDDRMLEI